MFDRLRSAQRAVRRAVAAVDAEHTDVRGARTLLAAGEEIERLGHAIKLLALKRLQHLGGWPGGGDAPDAAFVARVTGTSEGRAKGMLATARALAADGPTAAAMMAGNVSPTQAREIAAAVTADPDAEAELVETAAREGLGALRRACARVRAAARTDELAHHEAIRRARYVRAWTDADGAGRGEWKLTLDAQAKLLARLDAEADLAARNAEAAGAPIETRERYLADGLERLATTTRGGEPTAPETVLTIRVDHAAATRGCTRPGEISEIEGIGPVPVATALAMSTEALAYVVLHDGVDVTRIWRPDRTIPRALEIALRERDPTCVVPGCSVRDRLQIHHIRAFGDHGPTSLENCCRLCPHHHSLCTHRGWRVERSPGGKWAFLRPVRPPPGDGAAPDRAPPGDLTLAI